MLSPDARFTVGVSLKMYFGHEQTIAWARRIGEIARTHPAIVSGVAELFVIPTFPAIVPVRDALAGSAVEVGGQDLFWEDAGAYTGEVSGAELAEIGCSLVEIGHAERRALFFEDDVVIAAKVAAAYRNGLVPLLCVGELEQAPPALAGLEVATQIEDALRDSDELPGPVLIAYEPQWAIGAPEPASPDHIRQVVAALELSLAELPGRAGSRVIYGGSAGPELLTALGGEVRGLFLGRFAHDPEAVGRILDEALQLAEVPA